MPGIRQIRYFLTVADERSFTRAAEKLHISQPPLSMQIKAIEAELEVRLFERTNRGVRLTAAGEAYYRELRAIVQRLDEARVAAQRVARGEAGSLSVGFVSIADFTFLPETLKRFRHAWPDVDLHLVEETTNVQVQGLKAERIDVGIALAPINEPGIAFTPLFDETLVLAVPAGLAASGRHRPSLAEFSAQPFVLFPRPMAPGLFDAVQSYCAAAGFSPRILQYARQMQTIISIVSTGLGVSLVPASLIQLRRQGVSYLKPREASPRIGVGLAWRSGDSNIVAANFRRVAAESSRGWRRRLREGPSRPGPSRPTH